MGVAGRASARTPPSPFLVKLLQLHIGRKNQSIRVLGSNFNSVPALNQRHYPRTMKTLTTSLWLGAAAALTTAAQPALTIYIVLTTRS